MNILQMQAALAKLAIAVTMLASQVGTSTPPVCTISTPQPVTASAPELSKFSDCLASENTLRDVLIRQDASGVFNANDMRNLTVTLEGSLSACMAQ